MEKKYQISADGQAELKAARKANTDKKVDRRLKVLIMRAEGKKNKEIAAATEYHPAYISQLVSIYCNQGLGAIVENHYRGNRRNMSFAEESELLEEYRKLADQGKAVEVSQIKQAYEEKVGHAIGSGQIYCVLHRHGWQKAKQ
jgi:transposase